MFSLVTLQNSLSYTSFFLHSPHMWRFTARASFGAPGVAYLYLRSVLQQSFKLKRSHWFFFGIVLLGALTFSRFYLLRNIGVRYSNSILKNRATYTVGVFNIISYMLAWVGGTPIRLAVI